jgi:DNA-binding CsgD family transcriptional regulator
MHENIKLSAREREVIALVAQAKSRKIIASYLNISIHTVDTHLRHIHLKTKTHSLSELLIWAQKNCSEESLI